MKKFYPTSILLILCYTVMAFIIDPNLLAGKWEYTSKKPGEPFSLLAIFRTNGTFDGFINKKEFVSGTYHVKHDTLFISDPICNS